MSEFESKFTPEDDEELTPSKEESEEEEPVLEPGPEEETVVEKELSKEEEFDYEKREKEIEARWAERHAKLDKLRNEIHRETGLDNKDEELEVRRAMERERREKAEKENKKVEEIELNSMEKLFLAFDEKKMEIDEERHTALDELDEMRQKQKEKRIKDLGDKIGEI